MNDSIDSVVVTCKGEDFVVVGGGSNPSMALSVFNFLTETDIGDNESCYGYSSGETDENFSETEARLQLGLRMHTVPNVEI